MFHSLPFRQTSVAVSVPISVPDRKVFMNFGLQFSYNLATRLQTVIRPPFLPYDGRALFESLIHTGNDDAKSPQHVIAGNNHNITTLRRRQPRDTTATAEEQQQIAGTATAAGAAAARSLSSTWNDFDSMMVDGDVRPKVAPNADKYLMQYEQRYKNYRHNQEQRCAAAAAVAGPQMDDDDSDDNDDCDVQLDNNGNDDATTDDDPHRTDDQQQTGDSSSSTQDMSSISAGELYRTFEDTLHE